MPLWGWLVVGVGLLCIEMFLIDAQFYLVFIGVAAVIVGLIGLGGIAMPLWLQWLLFALLSVIAMVAFRARVYAVVRGRTGHVDERVTHGDRVVVPARLTPDETCRVEYRGSTWTARNVDEVVIEAGKEAAIVRVEGLTLHLKALPPKV